MATKARLVRAKDVLAKHLEDPKFRAERERLALARAVAIAVVGYHTKHRLTQTQLAERLSNVLGLRFILEGAPARKESPGRALRLPGVSSLLKMRREWSLPGEQWGSTSS